ncbi:GntR family transcriptional regulator [Cryobacterium roopkundense]|uniref:GntR family transcriptional regulator n=1 Tax=Cryobacterium roopkundense TaxID=1001240 RepID=A0A099J3W2_9MICO|nr:GntR family transcriptional regulator [Cryobacterium roopkundense]KGJ72760.1 GntR family transcriptional regulator [Cryobacterium roopkundense]MBB5643213.1 DNA-binding GntR family transcriptional regulator [Cryobacterium roopkundense]
MPGEDGLSALEGRPTSVLIADQLRERIIDGSFHPGEQIREASLVERLQVSRGPVREALQRLSQEGLLVSHRNRGVFVLDLTITDIREIYAAREAIELGAATEILAERRGELAAIAETLSRIIEEMVPLVAAGDWHRLSEVDLNFHLAFVKSAGNSRLSRIYSTLAAESRICMVNLEVSYPRPAALTEEHQHLVDLLVAGDDENLHRAIRQHMRSAITDLSASMLADKSHHG